MVLKEDVILRNEIYTMNSSELQERMKVYFKLKDGFIIRI